MILSGHQHNYLPWHGFFEKVMIADVFVIDNTSQYEKKSFMNRNKIKTSQGDLWLTVPIINKGILNKPNNEIYIDYSKNWVQQHLKAIKVSYGKSKYYKELYLDLYDILKGDHQTLFDLNIKIIKYIIYIMDLNTKIMFTSDMNCKNYRKSDFVLEMCKECGADTYFSGELGSRYIVEEEFKKNKIDIIYQKRKPIIYKQRFEPFIPNLSIIDIIFNCGPMETRNILRRNINEYLSSCGSPRR